jgi:preprotein translocase subunit SecE
VARDRKRAKQRRARRGRDDAGTPVGRSAGRPDPAGAANGGSGGPGGSGSSGGSPVRADVPGALDHASGDVDEFDAAIVRGAGGVPADAGAVPADLDGVAADPETLSEPEIEAEAEAEGDLTEDEIQELAGGSTGSGGGGRAGGNGPGGTLTAPGGGGSGGGATPEQASGAPQRGGNRAIGFLRASWAELQRVQWPDRRQVFQATAVVLGFVAIAGAYLGLADYVAKEIVEIIL